MIISEQRGDHIVCWLLGTYGYAQNAIYRLTAQQCNDDRINAVHNAIATLVEVRGSGVVGWFDDVTVSDWSTQRPAAGLGNDGQEQGRETSEAWTSAGVDAYTDDDWSFLEGSQVINVYNEAYIATDVDNDDDEQSYAPDAVLYSRKNQQAHNSAASISLSVAPTLACVALVLSL